ncbi:LemA family protein [Isoalcanivorax beigongshangi]|uniref:LemA family protein n=1 Tax=Isoalcanivorax beigongshangi TaxID=3238810 RepID=A0ABV4AFM5_9GAMM
MTSYVTLAVLLLALVLSVGVYNRLITLRNRFRNAFAQIDVQLQRRYDLIPNLVDTARAYMEHEAGTLTRITEARNSADSARQRASRAPEDGVAIDALGQAETALRRSLMDFNAVVENYPELRANESIRQLMEELSSTENRVGFARQAFNDAVMFYNTYREQFPNSIIAGLFKSRFTPAEPLTLDTPEARRAPRVSF